MALCVWAAKASGIWGLASRMCARDKALIFVIACGFIVFAGWYFGQYHFHPTWDFLNYWNKTLQFDASLSSSVHRAIADVYRSIGDSDYNLLLSWIFALPFRLFSSWEEAHFSVSVLFHVPLALTCALLVARVSGGSRDRSGFVPALFFCALCFPVFARVPFIGLSDVPAALLLALAACCFLSPELPRKRSCAVAGAVMLCGSFLVRRYFVYGAMGLAAGIIVFWLINLTKVSRDERRGEFLNLLKGLGLVLAVVAATVAIVPGFYARSLFGNQRTAYRSWTVIDSYTEKLGVVANSIGYIWIALSVVVIVLLVSYATLRHKDRREGGCTDGVLPAVCGAMVWMVVSLFAFWQVQDLSSQHWYIIMVPVLLISLAPVCCALALVSRARLRLLGLLALGAISTASLGSGFNVFPSVPGLPDDLVSIKYEADYDERQRFITELSKMAGEGESVYFAAASGSVNSSLSLSVQLVDGIPVSFASLSADVDSRDGFNTGFFDAEYVVTSDPVQLHLKPENERVVSTLNSLVRDSDSYVGRHYEAAGEYGFAGGVEVTVYRRVSDFTAEDVRALRDVFDGYYPENPELFRDRFDAYLEGME